MVVAEAPVPKKRKIINDDGQEITTGGLAKPVRNATLNLNMRYFLIHLHEYIGFAYDFKEATWLELDEAMKITSFIWTCYTVLKQEANA